VAMAMARALALFQVLWIGCALSVEIPYENTAELGTEEPLVPQLDWEALVQTGAGEVRATFGSGETQMDAMQAKQVKIQDTIVVAGKSTFEEVVEMRGRTVNAGGQMIQLGMSDGLKQLNKRDNRALYHHSQPADSLHINFNGDFEGGTVVGGPATVIQGKLVTQGKMTASKDLEVQGNKIILGTKDGKKQGSSNKNRALVHGKDDMLILNREGDFEGGVHVQGADAFFDGKIGIGKDHTKPQADIHIETSATSEIRLSHKTKTKNSVFVKAVPASGAGVDMEIGSTAGNNEYGKLIANFGGDITFLGAGDTNFQRGNMHLGKGLLGVGANSAQGKHGITVESDQKIGHTANDLALNRGSMHLHGGIYDISSKGKKFYLDLDKGGYVEGLNVATAVGIGTQAPKSPYGDTNKAVLHMVDTGRPTATLESLADDGHATVVLKSGKNQWDIDHFGSELIMSSKNKEVLVLDNRGKVGIGRKNEGEYGVNVHLADGPDNKLNDVAIPHGNLRLQGKIYDTFDGGDKFFLDPSKVSNVNDVNLEGKLSFKGVPMPSQFHVDVPKGDAHISVGRALFLNGYGQESARVTNNAKVDAKGGWALHDATKMASAMELRNNGQIEFLATKQAGKMAWEKMMGMDAVKGAVYTGTGMKFGAGLKDPKHTFHMPGGEHAMSLGDNMFLSGGSGAVSRITANAFMKSKQWSIPRRDRFAASIELKDAGGVDMYGTQTAGAVQWKKMFGFNAPKNHVYALGKLGVDMEKPTHTITIPSGEHHISLGDKMFLNGHGATTRIMANAYFKQGKVAIQDKGRQAVSIEMETASGKVTFGGTQSRGSDSFLKLFTVDFTGKAVSIDSGRLGVRTAKPKTVVDVRGHMNMQDPSNAGVIYTPTSGPGFFLRAADAPGNYAASQERYFFGNNKRVGFGTVQPAAKLHIVNDDGGEMLPHLSLETKGNLKHEMAVTKDGLKISTKNEGQSFTFKAGASTPLELYGKSSEGSVNGVKYKKSKAILVPDGGRAAVGGQPKGQHNLQLFGNGMMITGGSKPGSGVLAFANDGGGSGLQMDYHAGMMKIGSLPPTKHLKIKAAAQTHMAVLDSGRVGIGTTDPVSALTVKSNEGFTVQNNEGLKWTSVVTKDGHLEYTNGQGGYFKFAKDGGMHLTQKPSKYKLEVDGEGMMLAGGSKGKAPLIFKNNGGGKGFQMKYFKEKMSFGQGEGNNKVHMTLADSGLLGVGTTEPQHAVHVKHDSGIAIEHGSKAEKWNIATSKKATLNFNYQGKTNLAINNKGYVGIGTGTPTRALHVEGSVYISGKIHSDNNYLKKKAASLTVPKAAAPAEEVELNRLDSAEALIQLDEHVSAKMDDEPDTFAMVHNPNSKKALEPVDYASMMAIMHRVVQHQQETIKKLEGRVAALEAKQ